MTIVKSLDIIDMEGKSLKKYRNFDFSSENSSIFSDETLEDLSGPNFADFARQLAYNTNDGREGTSYYHPYDAIDPDKILEGTYVFPSTITQKVDLPKTTDVTTLFLVDSVNRDRKAFPQPTSLTLKLPRVYKNVKSLQISQVKLLCSFYYFSLAKSNIYLPVTEKNRIITTFNSGSISKKITIRQGTYSITELLSEIQTEMNSTPLFYDFPKGIEDFTKVFSINGDFSINFNQPGDSYYDQLNSKYIQNPTMATILSYYWGSRYAGLTEYTDSQILVAYYYPVLYEIFLDLNDTEIRPKLIKDAPPDVLSTSETAYSHLIFNMSGINDKVALYLIRQNLNVKINDVSILDIYRLNHTFRYSLVNRYQVAYDTNSLQVNFITTTLNTSLVNLINNTGAFALTSILTNLGYTAASYAAIQATASKSAVIYTDMYRFLQSQFISLLGISIGTYSTRYFNNINNTIYFQNGQFASGIRSEYTSDYYANAPTPLSSITTTSSNSPGYWPNMTGLNYGFSQANINPPETLHPYNSYSKNFQFDLNSIDPKTFFLNTNKTSRSLDIMVKILPAKYTILKFRSPVRQSLQVETLPLPYYYRYADYNIKGLYTGILDQDKNNVPQKYFDLSYNFVYNNTNKEMDSTNYSTTVLLTRFGQSLQTALTATSSFRISSQANYSQFEFIAPYPTVLSTITTNGITSVNTVTLSNGLYVNNTSLSFVSVVNNISTMFPDNFSAFLYHDRGAFMADLQFPRLEKDIHYIRTSTVGTSNSDLTINFSTFSGHKYYVIFRSNNLACSNLIYKPIIYNNDSTFTEINTDYTTFNPNGNPFDPSNLSTGEYVINYNTDFTRLPTATSVMGLNPNSSTFNVSLTIKNNPIGYDISGVSNDLTDYMGYTINEEGFYPNKPFSIDPLSYFIFQSNTPYNVAKETYFDSNSQNSILYPDTNDEYIFKGTSTAQLKIVHWYEGYSIPAQIDDPFTTLKTIGIAQTSSITSSITRFPTDPNNNIILGRGINAIGFLPNDGVFDISSFAFKSCIYPLESTEVTSEDPNSKIKYIGVFSGTTLVDGIITLETALTVLELSKMVPYGPGTSNLTPGYMAQYGTWYEYTRDPTYSNTSISGYTPLSSELLSYNSMYYMVPFGEDKGTLTYSLLSGSLLPYPLAQEVSTGSTFFGQTSKNSPGSQIQPEYVMPVELEDADTAYGPQGIYSQTQSQYQQSIPITTTSIGYKELPYLVNNVEAPFTFNLTFPTFLADISLTTYFSEYSDNLFIVNSINQVCSNTNISFQSAAYLNSLGSVIPTISSGKSDCIYYLQNLPSTLQNYDLSGSSVKFSTFTFKEMENQDSNVTVTSFEIDPSMSNIEIRLWGGGGGTWLNTSTISGGAGAYAKVSLNTDILKTLYLEEAPLGISTLYLVVGKGGNRDNVSIVETVGSLQAYEQPRYGGGGTSLLETADGIRNLISKNSLGLQGGGFSGIFTGPNLLTAKPLLIVGGGGAAGAYDLGGPGGFGVIPEPYDISYYSFSDATFHGKFYSSITVSTIQDLNVDGTNLENLIDGDLTTFWNPAIPARLNPSNFLPTLNTYQLNLTFQSPLEKISKIRVYGPPQGDISGLPTGIIVYASKNRSEILYSNTSIVPADFQILDNGSYLQQVFDIIPQSQPSTTSYTGSAWMVGGTNTLAQNSIQYSLDGYTWVPTSNSLLRFVTSVLYVPLFAKWFATGASILGSPIISSVDGINWVECNIDGFANNSITSMAFGSNTIVLGSNTGNLFYSTDGLNFSLANLQLSSVVTKIRYINGEFWAFGQTDLTIRKSSNGQVWTILNLRTSRIYDIAYGQGKYVIAQDNTTQPHLSGLIYSTDTITWFKVSQINITDFSGKSIVFANGLFVATGKSSSSLIKTSVDGINWLNSSLPSTNQFEINNVEYVGNLFIALGPATKATGKAGNQASIITSVDGNKWSYSYSGGFDPDLDQDINLANPSYIQGKSSSYGPVSIPPNPSSFYMEIQKNSFVTDELKLYELRVYDTDTDIIEPTETLIDSDVNTVFHPSELQTVDVIEYPFTLSLEEDSSGTYPSIVNEIYITLPGIPSALFTGITVSLDNTKLSQIYSDQGLTVDSFTYDEYTGTYQYTALLVPSISPSSQNITSLNITFSKATEKSLQLSEIVLAYNPNTEALELPASSTTVNDTDRRPDRSSGETVANIIDGDLTSVWYPPSFITGDSLNIEFTFDSSVIQNRINHLQIFNGPYPPVDTYLITGVTIYSDTEKSTILYSTNEPVFSQYLSYSVIDIDILPLIGYSSLYLELSKNTPGIPLINEIRFYNVGDFVDTLNGFSAATEIVTMNRENYALYYYNGGGGSTVGGFSGSMAYNGQYLTGGSPAILVNQSTITTTDQIEYGSGGGGGGYYGGGGGGIINDGSDRGGAGGGGSGYIYPQLFTVIDYGVAVPEINTSTENFMAPGLDEQETLVGDEIIQPITIPYGQGGTPGIDSGKGAHGLIVITYESSRTISNGSNMAPVYPSFIDGSKLTVFQAPIDYSSKERDLPFSTFVDPIELTEYSGYNWVWYSSYLSLIGLSLLPTFELSDTIPDIDVAQESFPALLEDDFTSLSNIFTEVKLLFSSSETNRALLIRTIVTEIQGVFNSFQETFIKTEFLDENGDMIDTYKDVTELYCLLDYLQNQSNLTNPHVNPSNPTLERILGGVPRFGYWANPFLVSASYIGFDVNTSQIPSANLSTLVKNGEPVQAIYGLIMEMSLESGKYEFKDVIAYKPSLKDSNVNGSDWLTVTQFPEGYVVRSLTDPVYLSKTVPVQPFSFKNAISARLSLFSYSVYTSPSDIDGTVYDIPIQILNDFEGKNIYMYSFQNKDIDNQSTINISQIPLTSTIIQMNQLAITNQLTTSGAPLGTLVSEYTSTVVQGITSFGFNGTNYIPQISYSKGIYNTFSSSSAINQSNVGKAIIDQYGNYFITDNQGTNNLYQNIGTSLINPSLFEGIDTSYNSPKYILNNPNTPYDFFQSKYTNIWHLPSRGNVTYMTGVRLSSPYDFSELTSFANQIFYPTHKITLVKKSSLQNPIQNTTDIDTYPSYQHTQMFFYKNYTSMYMDIGTKYAMENTKNFTNSDTNSGYGFNSYINNINLEQSPEIVDSNDLDSFNYLAIRAYSPTETFQSLVRFYLPQRYDFGYISLKDLSNEQLNISTATNVNPDYRSFLDTFNSAFSTTRNYGSVGVPGFFGSNITTESFGDFLTKFNTLNTINTSNSAIISTVTALSNEAIKNLIIGDLQYILPSSIANRNRTTDPIEFSIPFSTCVTPSNASVDQYGLGYNLGFALKDTAFNTVHRATSFFKILDDYIYLQLNKEFGMNKMDISQRENFAQTRDTTAQSGLYNSKLLLNNFGSFATTFVQSPVTFNPPIGKIDTLSFNWYDANGVLLNNNDCDWSGSVQIVESVTANS